MLPVRLDFQLWFATFSLLAIGMVTHLSLSSDKIFSQLSFIVIGLVAAYLVSTIDSRYLPYFGPYYFALIILLLLSPLILGNNIRGANRWITLAGYQFQPSEFAKPFFILMYAQSLCRFPPRTLKNLIILLLIALTPILLIFIQPDLGTAIIFSLITLGMTFVATLRYRIIILLLIMGIIISPLAWNSLKPYQKNRIYTFINPQSDPQGEGYNTIQSIIAVGSGRLLGKGLGRGSQSQLQFLPEYQTDFVFAAYAEEFGFVGSALLISLYFWLIWRLIDLAKHSQDNFSLYLTTGTSLMIFIQFAINTGMNIGIVPVTGITLPLISAGGSSLVATLTTLGLVQSMSHKAKNTHQVEIT